MKAKQAQQYSDFYHNPHLRNESWGRPNYFGRQAIIYHSFHCIYNQSRFCALLSPTSLLQTSFQASTVSSITPFDCTLSTPPVHSYPHVGYLAQKLDGRPVNLLDALVRTLLVGLVLPPLIQDADQRGLHDKARKTVLVMVR